MDLSQRSDLTQSVHRSSGSFELVLSAVLFSLLGVLVDRAVGTLPVFTLVFAALGFAGATISIWFRYRAQMANIERPATWAGADRSAS